MNHPCEPTKKNRQKLNSLINKGGIKYETRNHDQDPTTKQDKKPPQTYTLWKSFYNLNSKLATQSLSHDKDHSHIYFENADDIVKDDTNRFGLNDFDVINNRTQYSKELIQVNEESSESSSGDERISRAFGVERSLTMTPRIKSYHIGGSFKEENPEIEQSMLTDELRTLSFLNENEDELDAEFEFQKNRFKNRMQKNSLMSNIQTKNLKNFELSDNKLGTSQRKTEASLFSTQDSRKYISSSFNQRHESFNNQNNSAHLIEIFDSSLSNRLHSESKEKQNDVADNEKKFDYMGSEHISHPNDISYNLYCNSLQQDPKIFYNYYIPNRDMDLITKIRKPETINSFSDTNMSDIDDQMQQQKTSKRNYLRVDDANEFTVKTDKIEDSKKTTLMIKNIPNKYTKELMLETIDASFDDTYDFFYLPIDFKNNCNVGYAFINFKNLKSIKAFYEEFNNKKWAKFNSEKICEIKYARIQGKDECESHFKGSSLMKNPVS